jgi:hypothetical protein
MDDENLYSPEPRTITAAELTDEAAQPGAPPGAKPTYRLLNPTCVGVATFIGSILAGGVAMAFNYRRLGRSKEAWVALLGGAVGLALLWQLGTKLDGTVATGLGAVIALGMQALAKSLQGADIEAHVAANGAVSSGGFGVLLGLPFLAAIVAYAIYGPSPWGASVSFGQETVYYADGATEADARALGEGLIAFGLFDKKSEKDVQLRRDDDTFVVRIVITKEAWKNRGEILGLMEYLTEYVSSGPFKGGAVRTELCDSHFETKHTIESTGRLGLRLAVGPERDLFYGGSITAGLAQDIGRAFTNSKLLGSRWSARISRTAGTVTFCFSMIPKAWKNPQIHAEFNMMAQTLSSEVFQGATVKAEICDRMLVTKVTVAPQ